MSDRIMGEQPRRSHIELHNTEGGGPESKPFPPVFLSVGATRFSHSSRKTSSCERREETGLTLGTRCFGLFPFAAKS